MELVYEGLLFIEILFQPLGDCEMVVHFLSWESLFWRLPVCRHWFSSLVHGCVSSSRVGFLLSTVIS